MKHWRHTTTRLRSDFALCGLREVDGVKFTSRPALIDCPTCLRLKRLRAAVARAVLTAADGRGMVSGMVRGARQNVAASPRAGSSSAPAADAATPALFASPANGRASAGQATGATEAGSGYGIVATTHGDEGAHAARAAEERRAELRGSTEVRR